MIELDTDNTIWVALDPTNAEVKILLPRNCKLKVEELLLGSPDPRSPDDAAYKLLEIEMDEHRFELP